MASVQASPGGSASGHQIECSYAGCNLPALKHFPVCRTHWDLVRKMAGKSSAAPASGDRRPPSPPHKKPPPFETTTARLLPDPEPIANVFGRNVMRKTAPGARSSGSSSSKIASLASSQPPCSSILQQCDGIPPQDGPDRKRRRLEDRLEDEMAIRAPRDARASSARPFHNTLSSQAFYGTRPQVNGQSTVNGGPGAEKIASIMDAQDGPPAAPAPSLPTDALSTTQEAVQATARPAIEMAACKTAESAVETTAQTAASAPNAGRTFNPSLTNWFLGSYSRDYLGPNSRVTTAPNEPENTNSTPQVPLVLSMPLATKATEPVGRGNPMRGQHQRGKPGPAGPPAKEQQRLRATAQPDLPALDAFIYGQESAQLPPPRGVALRPRKEPPKPRDEPFFAHVDPRVHWCRPRSDSWYEEKQKEINARPDRKSNFGMAARRIAERERADQQRSAPTSSAPTRSRQDSKSSSRDAPADKGPKGASNAAALARLRKTFDAWDQALWERDKEATRRELEKDRFRKERDRPRLNGAGQASGSRR